MINAKAVFRKVLKQWGHDIYLQRRLSDDFIYSDTLERYTVRNTYPRKMSLTHAQNEVPEGIFVNSELLYYFEHNVNPKPGDRIYEQSYNGLDDSILYVIDDSYPVRGRYGEINYWIAGATKEVPS